MQCTSGGPTSTRRHPSKYFLPRAAAISPDAPDVDRGGRIVQRSYQELSNRAMGLAYYLRSRGHARVGILAPNTLAFLEAIFVIGAVGGINVAAIIVDSEYADLLDGFRHSRPHVAVIIDSDEADVPGPLDDAIRDGLALDRASGSKHWYRLPIHPQSDNGLEAFAYTSGTTARPKGVDFLHQGAYLASLANVAEFGSMRPAGTGWGAHFSMRKIDYPAIWRLLKQERITHLCAASTVSTLLYSAPEALLLPHPVLLTAVPWRELNVYLPVS
ncbi:hypothetical protein B0J12DRAFT_785678 [Macrophomina phaseolina]|uniref:AMP-dependent synthetase/ligase domain-containing protein n=1 Tax=Macrophomina phaseolina TaxID=35725 RepID=A0ABQ8GAL5_9PEZI|nr:hypothetical protein B0J12DRAFT_785678 [Macrophomina phaseolina]